ncbi:hypothetical protein Glove_209g158 [Diversispora epigaea]|uniref:Uncharacterized protein n=1 Tax=Diversispora epigaea TaxID=1348612 RepID=A0A397IIN6_9GLOM|nr:hypothetical protein Glove_209g158 [Diversispora epigaea]
MMSERETHEPYVGYGALKNYLKTYENKSYCSFLGNNRNIIISSIISSKTHFNWNDLDNLWAGRFLSEAIKLNTTLDEKVKYERSGKWLKPYWNNIIKEYKRNFALKCFVYKIINPEQIPENYQNQTICEIYRKEISPQFPEPITILTYPKEQYHYDDSVGSSGSGYDNYAGDDIGSSSGIVEIPQKFKINFGNMYSTNSYPPVSSEVVDNNEQEGDSSSGNGLNNDIKNDNNNDENNDGGYTCRQN